MILVEQVSYGYCPNSAYLVFDFFESEKTFSFVCNRFDSIYKYIHFIDDT
jgi:hypothetical protein